MDGPVTLAEVARVAGVSLATASRVLNGGPRRPREDLRTRVLDAAGRLQYTPNAAAQAVARGRTTVVGLVVQDLGDPYFSAIATGVVQAADEQGLVTTIFDTRRDPAREVRYVASLRQQRARAVILAGSRTEDAPTAALLAEEVEAFRASGGRVTLLSQQRFAADTVLVENRAGARALAEALVGLGHREFVVLAGPAELRTSTDRLTGFREGLARSGAALPAGRVLREDFTRDGGYRAAKALLASGLRPSCLFAVNDVMAVGAMAALRDAGLRLPQDLAVAGFDDIATLRDVVPALTTVHLPLERLGTEALALALAEPSPDARPRLRRVGGTVVVRESTPALA